MITIAVKRDFSGLSGSFKQVPFATALALTRTAQDVQAEVRRQLPRRFTIRNNWVSQGIRITKATKQDLTATVYSKDKFMKLQETGGVKTSKGTAQGIPVDVKASARGIVPRGLWPRALLGRPDVFRAVIHGVDGLWQRLKVSRRKRGRGARSLKLLYVLKPFVPIRPRFGFVDTARETVAKVWANRFREAFAQAMRTARR